jgi:hypothetical protein
MQLPWIQADKANHIAYGAAIACVGAFHSVIAGAALCAALGIGKEVYDRVSRKGTPDVLDAVATLAGGALVLAPLAAWRWGGYL